MPVKRHPDYWIIACAVILLAIGIVMIFSSSAAIALQRYDDPYYFLKRQSAWAVLGIVAMMMAMRIDYRRYSRYSYLLYALAALGLVMVLVPGIGHSVNGAQRWISLGFATFQPSEFAKLALLIFFAGLLAKKSAEGKLRDFQFGFVPNLAALGLIVLLIQLQPDLGTAIMIALSIFFMFIVAGMRMSFIVSTALFTLPFVLISIFTVAYRKKRIMSFLNPWDDTADSGYQIIQSFIALSNGGLWGTGLGASQQKLFYLPEPHTDFIFSIMVEETGFVGAICVLALFMILTWRGFRVGLRVHDKFGSLLALGITFAISAQAIVNIAVTLGMLPTKGLPLPFISLGGSALVMWMISVGILTNISEHAA